MLRVWGFFSVFFLYLELIYHVSSFGITLVNPVFLMALCGLWAAVITFLICAIKKDALQRGLTVLLVWLPIVWTGAQEVYLHIFKQPLLWEAIFMGGEDALTHYWRETITGILEVSVFLLLMILPGIWTLRKVVFKRVTMPCTEREKVQILAGILIACLVGSIGSLGIGKALQTDLYEQYHEFFDPMTVAEKMGVLPMFQKDTVVNLGRQWQKLSGQASENSKKKQWLDDYRAAQKPAAENAYTGLFADYNLIFLTAEGFSPYAIREDLTPTLYRLTHSGFVFENYYVPLWQTSTSDGEYINSTGLIPDAQFSMGKSAQNDMAFTLPHYFSKAGAECLAYHNNSLDYYNRYLTHNNLGYVFKGNDLGALSADEWGDCVFEMENPKAWPASDYDMMVGTIPDYVNRERFLVYYMTVSGHMNYNFITNQMSIKNKDAVADLEMSDNAKAYIACNIELDKALTYLLEQLEQAGRLEQTVICLSADHYPYAMTEKQYEELAGKSLKQGMDLYRNSLVLWNASMEDNPVTVTKACSSMDLVPTLLNLFGFSYDNSVYAGRDIFSEEEGLVIFNDRSFVTDSCIYNRNQNRAIWLADGAGNSYVPTDRQQEYLKEISDVVRDRYRFSAYVLQEDYYRYLK